MSVSKYDILLVQYIVKILKDTYNNDLCYGYYDKESCRWWIWVKDLDTYLSREFKETMKELRSEISELYVVAYYRSQEPKKVNIKIN
jgi:hypothetical protein